MRFIWNFETLKNCKKKLLLASILSCRTNLKLVPTNAFNYYLNKYLDTWNVDSFQYDEYVVLSDTKR